MAKFKEIFCYSCDGTFRVKHEEGPQYKIEHCVFCGSNLSEDDPQAADDVEYDSED
ncbi:hypothetical protein [Synechococcus phage BUCT-ZZ01]|nr:hypothetical protein [Synechococcus phage BUCT-ZZ01]